MISANGGLPAHRYTPQVTPRWPRGSEPASIALCSEYTRANLAVAVRGFVQKVAHVAMSEGTYECKSISTSKIFD